MIYPSRPLLFFSFSSPFSREKEEEEEEEDLPICKWAGCGS
jgi:hypothetical protein